MVMAATVLSTAQAFPKNVDGKVLPKTSGLPPSSGQLLQQRYLELQDKPMKEQQRVERCGEGRGVDNRSLSKTRP